MLSAWSCVNKKTNAVASWQTGGQTEDGVPKTCSVVYAHTKGEARHLLKERLGERPAKKGSGKRLRLPVGYSVHRMGWMGGAPALDLDVVAAKV